MAATEVIEPLPQSVLAWLSVSPPESPPQSPTTSPKSPASRRSSASLKSPVGGMKRDIGDCSTIGASIDDDSRTQDISSSGSEAAPQSPSHRESGCEVRRLQKALKEMSPLLKMEHESLTRATQMIIERGWENITWNRQYTALHLAAELGQKDAIPLLVLLKADPNQTDYKERTPADIARKWKQLTTLEILQKYEDEANEESATAAPDNKDGAAAEAIGNQSGTSAFSGSAVEDKPLEKERHRLEDALVEASKFLNVEPRLGRLIISAASAGWHEAPSQTTSMHVAAHLGCEDVMSLLLTLVGNVDVKDMNGWTPMDVAIAGSQWSCVAKLRLLQRDVGECSEEMRRWASTGGGAETAPQEVECVRLRFPERDRTDPVSNLSVQGQCGWPTALDSKAANVGLDYMRAPGVAAGPHPTMFEQQGLPQPWMHGAVPGFMPAQSLPQQDPVLPPGSFCNFQQPVGAPHPARCDAVVPGFHQQAVMMHEGRCGGGVPSMNMNPEFANFRTYDGLGGPGCIGPHFPYAPGSPAPF